MCGHKKAKKHDVKVQYFINIPGCAHWVDRYKFWRAGLHRRPTHILIPNSMSIGLRVAKLSYPSFDILKAGLPYMVSTVLIHYDMHVCLC